MRIGHLAELTGVPARTLRFYEAQGLLPAPARTAAGYRDYDPAIAERVAFIRHAQSAGLTLAQIRDVLAVRDDGRAPCEHVAGFVEQRLGDVERRVEELTATRHRLLALRERLRSLEPAACAPDEICSAMTAGDGAP